MTGCRLDSLGQSKPACFALLDQASVTHKRRNKTSDSSECGITDGWTLDKSFTPYSGTIETSCRFAGSLRMWERHVVLPAAQELLGHGVKCIETIGTYQCRGVNNASTGRWSEHANGEAIDISGFTLDDSPRVMVEGQFNSQTREGAFLRRVRAMRAKGSRRH